MNESAKHEAQAVAWIAAGPNGSRKLMWAEPDRDMATVDDAIPLYTAPADGVRRGMELAIAAVDAEAEKWRGAQDIIDFRIAAQVIREAIGRLPVQDAAKDDEGAQESQDAKDAWISVAERLPDYGVNVLLYRPNAAESNDPIFTTRSRRKNYHGPYEFEVVAVPTHWMPLVAPALRDEAEKRT